MLTSGAWRTGLGFGPVLGERYGVSDPSDPRPLRNVHNSHLTVFARTGAVGLGVWALLWLVWCLHLHRWIRRRPGGVRDPAGAIAGWVLAGAVGLLVNAYFDPSLEGPQACVWLYALLGMGAAKTRRPWVPSTLGIGGGNGLGIDGLGLGQWSGGTQKREAGPPGLAEPHIPVVRTNRWDIAGLAPRARRLQGIGRRLGWAVADQALSSLTNFLVGVFVARSLGPAGFGVFSVAFATYLIALNASRGLATDPLLVRYSGAKLPEWRSAVAGSMGTAVAVGAVGGVACAAFGIIVSGPTGLAFVALGMTLPGLLLQDGWRFAFFSAGKAGRAFLNDLLRTAALLVLVTLVIASGRPSEFSFMLAWGTSATIAAVVGAAQAGLPPRVSMVFDWLRRHRVLCSRYLAENLSVAGGTQLKFYGLAAVGGFAVVGTLRAAELLFGGVYVITQGIALMAVPEAVRLLRQSTSRLRQFCLLLSVLAGGGALACSVALLVTPDSLGQRLLHASWAPAASLLLPTSVYITAFAIQIGAWAGVRALAAASRSLLSQGVGSALSVAGALAGAAAAGAVGAAWGIAAAAVVGTSFWWWQFHLELRHAKGVELQAAEQPDATTSS
jgi:O-antigen/teichoic acid export membrane protein